MTFFMNSDVPPLLQLPSEGVQTCLAALLVLAFGTGVATVGALHRLVLARWAAWRRRPGPRALGLGEAAEEEAWRREALETTALGMIVLLLRCALGRGPRV